MKYRKQRRAFDLPGHVHFVTFSCRQKLPLLAKDRSRRWVIAALDEMRTTQHVAIWAYVLMPEHVHLLLAPSDADYEMRRILAAIKAPVSRKAKDHLLQTGQTHWLDRLNEQRGGRNVFRFWQPGGGYDKNLWNERVILEVIDYIHANPVRRGLVQQPADWYWSSAGAHAGLPAPLQVDPVAF